MLTGFLVFVTILMGLGFAAQQTQSTIAGLIGAKRVPVYRVSTHKTEIAVTFNAAWEADEVPEILEVLQKYEAKCTFFVLGEFVDKNPEAVRAVAAAGHEIANHSDSHPNMTGMPEDKIRRQILNCDDKIKALVPEAFAPFFRAPSGAYDNRLIETAEALGHQVIQWDVDSHDWQEHITADALINYCFTKTKAGSILLFHVGTKRGYTPRVLPCILENFKNQGFSFVKLSELVYPDDGKSYVDLEGVQWPG
jgi:peptidoglycan/xylan/chitin deacetylase (PgdA/CDA1 family)